MELLIDAKFWFAVIRSMTPVLLVAMGACVARKAGLINLAHEGIMLICALAGVMGSAYTGSLFWGMMIGLFFGVVMEMLMAYLTLSLKSDIVITGVAINMAATGGTVFVMYSAIGDRGVTAQLHSLKFPTWEIPLIKDIPVLGDILSGHNALTYLSLVMVVVTFIFIYKTPFGKKIRAVGQTPDAAKSVGISTNKVQSIAFLLCGIMVAFGGMFLSMGYMTMFTANMTAGRGFIALAATNMAGGHPLGAFAGAIIYGFSSSLANYMQNSDKIPLEAIMAFPYLFIVIAYAIFSYVDRKRNKEDQVF